MAEGSVKWANSAPAGLGALAVACFCFYAYLGGHVEPTSIPLLGLWLLGGALVQYTVCILEYKEGALVGGNVFHIFAAFFMMVSGLELIFKYLVSAFGWLPIDHTIDGFAWVALWIFIWAMTLGYLKSPFLLFVLVLCIDIGVPIVALHDLGIFGHAQLQIASYAFLTAGILGLYIAAAIVMNNEFKRTILPMPGALVRMA